MYILKLFIGLVILGCVLVIVSILASREKINAVNLPREAFGVKLGINVGEIKNISPHIIQEDKQNFVYPHPSLEIKKILLNLSAGKAANLISFNIQYEKHYSSKTSFKQFLSECERKFGSGSEYWNDREWVKEQVYWKDGKTRIIAGQDLAGDYFMIYEDLTHHNNAHYINVR